MGGNRWKNVTLKDRLEAKTTLGPLFQDGSHCLDWTGTKTARGYGAINPLHLEPVTRHENILRSSNFCATAAAKTHCKRGHEFTPENTYIHPRKKQRSCRECHRLNERRRRRGLPSLATYLHDDAADLAEAMASLPAWEIEE